MLVFADAGYPADRMIDAIAVNLAAQQLRELRERLRTGPISGSRRLPPAGRRG
jgi:hypothetical protein